MFVCPNCKSILVRKLGTTGIYWACDRCGGRAVGLGVLRQTIGDKLVTEVWSRATNSPAIGDRPCPICLRTMQEVRLTVENTPLVLDICQRCEFMWFDPSEYESIPPPPPKPRVLGDIDEKTLPQELRVALAIQKIELMQANEEPEPDSEWKSIPAAFGLPIEMDSPISTRLPWATYLLSALITIVSVWAFFNLQFAINKYGLIPAQAWRYDGLTFLTSFFLHGGIFHLASNIYFLVIFGCRVENFLGRWRWMLLVLLSALMGDLLHIMADPRTSLPCIGASGGISGLIVFYALKFPHARLGYLFNCGYIYFRWIQFPAWIALVFWVLLQAWGVCTQIAGYGSVSALAHLGGSIIGIGLWLAWRNLDSKSGSKIKDDRLAVIQVSQS